MLQFVKIFFQSVACHSVLFLPVIQSNRLILSSTASGFCICVKEDFQPRFFFQHRILELQQVMRKWQFPNILS